MDYIIFDLEFNQPTEIKKEEENNTNFKCPHEIIQIGALKLDGLHNTLATFNALVKPTIYTKVHPFVEKITRITTKQLIDEDSFVKVYKDFLTFINGKENVLCIWGMADITELFKNISYHKMDNSLIPRSYINVQDHVSKHFRTPHGKKIGLQTAIKFFNMSLDKSLHDAFNDAFYTAEIFKKIHGESIEPQIYNPDYKKNKNQVNHKRTLDAERLINQFEKMYKRKMSQEEISIILLSYKMGQTHQFQKEI